MIDSNSKDESDFDDSDMASALNELRDALVDLSLTMKDFMFEVDFERRSQAKEKSQELVERVKAH